MPRMLLSFVIAFMIASSSLLAQATQPTAADKTHSTDGIDYGNPIPLKIKFGRLPITINGILSNSPWGAFAARHVWSKKHSPDKVDMLFKSFPSVPDIPAQFFTPANNDTVIGFDVEDGRIVRVVRFLKSTTKANLMDYGNQLDLAAKQAPILWDIKFPPMDDSSAPGALIVSVDEVAWYLANNKVDDNVADAMRSRELLVGMNIREMNAAMQPYIREDEAESENSQTISWYQWQPPPMGEPSSGGNSSSSSFRKHRYFTVVVSKGAIVAVEKD